MMDAQAFQNGSQGSDFNSMASPNLAEKLEGLIGARPLGDPLRSELEALRGGISAQEQMVEEARLVIEKLDQIVRKLTAPANRVGVFLGSRGPDAAQVLVGGVDYLCNCDPRVEIRALRKGSRVLLNEAYVIVGDLGHERSGPVVKVQEILGSDRLRVGTEHSTSSIVLERSEALLPELLKAGDEVRVDGHYKLALELLARAQGHDYSMEHVPELPWDQVGGQEAAIQAIRDAIELPLLHPELFRRFEHQSPKGFLLHGPPGCGKTLIGKATAYNLTQQFQRTTGRPMREYFMHIKGPEILNMWVGESERLVREIFAGAREKRREGFLPFLFIDEAESILGTRRSTRYSSILSTLVPMFCTEMDGIESLDDVVIILASNRADLIDPAILRPGRIDRKIKVERPRAAGAREIFKIYLRSSLPFEPELVAQLGGVEAAREALVERMVELCFSKREENRFLQITLRSGKKETLYRGDLLSGAMIASMVERAKSVAIKRAIASGGAEGLREEDLRWAFEAEYGENHVFPPSEITEDWLQLLDYDPENVVKVAPIRGLERERRSAVI